MLYFQECIVEIYFCKVLTADPLKINYEPKGNPPMNAHISLSYIRARAQLNFKKSVLKTLHVNDGNISSKIYSVDRKKIR